MKKYIFTLIALSMIFTATARKPKNTRTTEAAAREIAAADSLRLVASRQAALIDSLQNLVAVAEQRDETAESETAAPDPVVDPEQAAADSVAALRLRLRPTKIESIFDTNGLTVLDTLATENDAVQVTCTATIRGNTSSTARWPKTARFSRNTGTRRRSFPTRRSTCRKCPNRW